MSKCTSVIARSTGLSALGDHFCRPPSEWPAAKSSEIKAEMRSASVVVTAHPPRVPSEAKSYAGRGGASIDGVAEERGRLPSGGSAPKPVPRTGLGADG